MKEEDEQTEEASEAEEVHAPTHDANSEASDEATARPVRLVTGQGPYRTTHPKGRPDPA